MRKIAAASLLIVGLAGFALANPGPPSAPEIDPNSVLTALAFAGSAMLMLKKRSKG